MVENVEQSKIIKKKNLKTVKNGINWLIMTGIVENTACGWEAKGEKILLHSR